MMEQYSIVWKYRISLITSLVDIYLGCFHLWGIEDIASRTSLCVKMSSRFSGVFTQVWSRKVRGQLLPNSQAALQRNGAVSRPD